MSLLKKRLALCACALLLTLPLGGCVGETAEALPSPAPAAEMMEDEAMVMEVRIGEQVFSATLADSTAARALADRLAEGPLTLELRDYGGFEKVGPLGFELPAEDRQTTTQAGDIVLYQGDQIVLFYGSNAWRYTHLARVEALDGWEEALGDGDVRVTPSLP